MRCQGLPSRVLLGSTWWVALAGMRGERRAQSLRVVSTLSAVYAAVWGGGCYSLCLRTGCSAPLLTAKERRGCAKGRCRVPRVSGGQEGPQRRGGGGHPGAKAWIRSRVPATWKGIPTGDGHHAKKSRKAPRLLAPLCRALLVWKHSRDCQTLCGLASSWGAPPGPCWAWGGKPRHQCSSARQADYRG